MFHADHTPSINVRWPEGAKWALSTQALRPPPAKPKPAPSKPRPRPYGVRPQSK